MENLGNVLQNIGDYALAKQYLEKALKIQEHHYGTTDPDTARTIAHLKKVLIKIEKEASSKKYLAKVLKIRAQYYGATYLITDIICIAAFSFI